MIKVPTIAAIGLGSLLIWFNFSGVMDTNHAPYWPGRVNAARVRTVNTLYFRWFRFVTIRYEYQVGDRTYSGKSTSLQRDAVRLEPGYTLDLYVNPANPADSCVVEGHSPFPRWGLLFAGSGLLVLGLLDVWPGYSELFRKFRRKRSGTE